MLCIKRNTAWTSSYIKELDSNYLSALYTNLMFSELGSGEGDILISMISFSRSGIFSFREVVDIFLGFDIESVLLAWRE